MRNGPFINVFKAHGIMIQKTMKAKMARMR